MHTASSSHTDCLCSCSSYPVHPRDGSHYMPLGRPRDQSCSHRPWSKCSQRPVRSVRILNNRNKAMSAEISSRFVGLTADIPSRISQQKQMRRKVSTSAAIGADPVLREKSVPVITYTQRHGYFPTYIINRTRPPNNAATLLNNNRSQTAWRTPAPALIFANFVATAWRNRKPRTPGA